VNFPIPIGAGTAVTIFSISFLPTAFVWTMFAWVIVLITIA